MRVFDLLHVMGGHDDGAIEQSLHLAAPESYQADGGCAFAPRQFQRAEHVRRIAAAADAEGHILSLDEILNLSGKNLFVFGVIGPRRDHRHVVRNRERLQPLGGRKPGGAGEVCGLAEISRHMGCQGRASAVTEQEYGVVGFVSAKEEFGRPLRLPDG